MFQESPNLSQIDPKTTNEVENPARQVPKGSTAYPQQTKIHQIRM